MKKFYYMMVVCFGFYLCGVIGSAAAEPLDRTAALHVYMGALQEQSRLYSARMRAAAESEEDRLMQEFRRKLRREAQQLLNRRPSPEQPPEQSLGSGTVQAAGRRKADYLRIFEHMAELYVSRYLQPQAARRRTLDSRGDGLEELLQQVNAGLSLSGNKLKRWEAGEYELLDQRAAWEQQMEAEYARQLTEIRSEYQQVEARHLQQLENIQQQYRQGSEYWQGRIQQHTEAWEAEFAALKVDVRQQSEEAGNLLGQLSTAYQTSQTVLEAAERQLYLQKDVPYWSGVRERELERIEQIRSTWNSLVQPGRGLAASLLEAETEILEDRITSSQQRCGQCGDLLQGQHSAALDDFLSAALKNEMQNLAGLQAQLKAAEAERAAARAEAGSSEKLEAMRTLLRRSAELQQVGEQIDQSLAAISGRCAAVRAQAAQRNTELIAGLKDLFPGLEVQSMATPDIRSLERLDWEDLPEQPTAAGYAEQPERLSRDAALWALELQQQAEAGTADEFLKQSALALYHEDRQLLDPGYCSRNQSYLNLEQKLGSSADTYLGSRAAQAYASIAGDDRRRRLYHFYAMLIRTQPEAELSELSRAAIEDLGEVLFGAIADHAGRRASDLAEKRDDLLTKAAVYTGLAAACYATLNFPGGAAMTALAAGYAAKAADVRSKRNDLKALRRSIAAQAMNGDAERTAVKQGLNIISSCKAEIEESQQTSRLLEEKEHSDEYWRMRLTAGEEEFGFTRFFSDDTFGADPLYSFLRGQAEQHSGGRTQTGTLKEYLRRMRASAAARGEELRAEREAEARQALSRIAAIVPSESRYESVDELARSEQQLRELYDEEQFGFYLSGGAGAAETESLLTLLHTAAAGRLEHARRRAALLKERVWGAGALWQQGMELEIAAEEERRDDELSALRRSGLEWDRKFRREYLDRQQMWEQRLNTYHRARQSWMRAAVRKEAADLSAAGAEILNLDPDSVCGRLSVVPLDGVTEWAGPAAVRMDRQDRDLLQLFSAAEAVEGESLVPEIELTRQRYAEYRESVATLYRNAEQQARQTAYEAGVRSLSGALRGHQQDLEAMLDTANAQVAVSLHTTLRAAGYRRNGDAYQRNAVVDVTYFEHQRELQSIGAYREYCLPPLDWAARLKAAAETGGDIEAVHGRYEELLRSIEARRNLIFGGYGDDPAAFLQQVDADARTRFSAAAARFSGSAGYSAKRDMRGLFYWHVGYAPVMSESDAGRLQRAGYGQSGRILTAYYRNEARLGRGLAMMDQAGWDRRLWDDDSNNDGEADGLLRAATIRSLSDLGLKTVAGLGLGPVAAALAGLTDDALFAVMDVSGGYRRWDTAAFDFGKQALLQTAAAASGGVWGGMETARQWDESAALFGNLAPAVGRRASGRLLAAGSAGLRYRRGEGLQWEAERFREALWNSDTAVEIGLAAAGSVTGAAVHNRFLHKQHTYGFAQEDIGAMRRGASFAGQLAAGGAEYALTGQTSLNLLGLRGNGLLKLNLDSDSAELAFSSGGRTVSAGLLADLFRGGRLFGLQQRIAAVSGQYAADGRQERIARMLRFQAGFGDERGRAVLNEILRGEVVLRFPEEADYRGRTELGAGSRREISIALGRHRGFDDPSLALTLQHEAHRDGRFLSGNDRETAEAVLAHTAMAAGISSDPLYGIEFLYKDGSIIQDMAAIAAGESGIAALMRSYSSDEDFWRVNAAGDLLWDGSHHLWGENGMLVHTHGPGSFSQDVADYMGISRDAALELMRKAGYMWNESRGTYEKSPAEFGLKVRPELAAQYDLLRRFGERVDGQMGLEAAGPTAAYAWALREQAYLKKYAARPGEWTSGCGPAYLEAMDGLLADRESFEQAAGYYGTDNAAGTGFGGIEESATLRRYSQQQLERAVCGAALDAAAGNGYCLAESIAAHYVDTFKEVDWDDIERAFSDSWGGSFDPATGWVGDKRRFSEELSRRLGVSAVAREYRFESLTELNYFLGGEAYGGFDDYSLAADYGGHFTHVRPDGIELNTYAGWSAPEDGPQEWRVYAWDY